MIPYHDVDRYIHRSNIHGTCDVCRQDGTVNELTTNEDWFLCRGCIDTLDSQADALLNQDSNLADTIDEAMEYVLGECVGATITLHYPVEHESPTDEQTVTVDGVDYFETEFGSKNTITIEKVTGETERRTGTGLSVSGMTR